jgi:hypothetical protein
VGKSYHSNSSAIAPQSAAAPTENLQIRSRLFFSRSTLSRIAIFSNTSHCLIVYLCVFLESIFRDCNQSHAFPRFLLRVTSTPRPSCSQDASRGPTGGCFPRHFRPTHRIRRGLSLHHRRTRSDLSIYARPLRINNDPMDAPRRGKVRSSLLGGAIWPYAPCPTRPGRGHPSRRLSLQLAWQLEKFRPVHGV